MFHTQICANGTKFVINGRMSISAWKTHIVFLRIKIVNISPATRDLQISTACSATAPCTAWSTAQGIPGISRKTADGSRTAQTAPSHMIRSIMIRSCRSCGRIRHCPTAAAKMVAGPAGDYSAGIHPSSPTRTFSLEKYVSTSGFTRHLERGLRPEQSAPGPKFPYSI
jgi:hypothetical protein